MPPPRPSRAGVYSLVDRPRGNTRRPRFSSSGRAARPSSARPRSGGGFLRAVLALLLLLVAAAPASADLEVSGQKTFQYRGYSQTGSFNQFIQDNGSFLTGTGFDQSLRLDVKGTVYDNVKLELTFDDSLTTREDQKMLLTADAPYWSLTAGRAPIVFDDTQFIIYNKTALGVMATGLVGKNLLTLVAARPEGRQRRQTFNGNGSQQEFVLSDANGKRNPHVVQGSDIVYLDGRRLEHGKDYDIDYEEGSIVLKQALLPVEPTSLLTVEFETTDTENSNTGTLLGFRDRYFFDGLDDLTDRDPDDQYVAVSLVTNNEETPATTGTLPSSTRLTVGGFDGHVRVGDDMLLKAEVAASSLTADTPSGPARPGEEGHALSFDLAREEGRLTFDLSHQEVTPGFEAIGKTAFVRLNERSDLIRDVSTTNLAGEYDFDKKVEANLKLDKSNTNVDDNPSLPTIDFEALLAGVTYNATEDESLSLRRQIERQDTAGSSTASGLSNRDVSTAIGKVPVFGLAGQASIQDETNESTLPGVTVNDFITRRFSLGAPPRSRVNWSASIEEQLRPGLGQSTSEQVLVDVTPLKTMKGTVSLLRRVDEGPQTPNTTAENGTTDTGEIKLRYDPFPDLHADVKETIEQRNRIALVRDPRLPPLTVIDPNAPQTIVTQNPILRFSGSDTLEWKPSKRFDHRVQYRINREQDKVTDAIFSQNDALNYRLKFAATSKLRFVTEWEKSDSYNQLAPIDSTQQTKSFQVMNAFPRGLSATVTRKSVDAVDNVLHAPQEELTNDLTLEKILSRILTATGGVTRGDRTGRYNDDSWTAKAGVRYSPAKLPLRTELNVAHSSIDGVTTAGAPLSSYKDTVGIKADYRISPQTLVEVSTDVTDAGPTVAGDPGYKAITGQAKVSINF